VHSRRQAVRVHSTDSEGAQSSRPRPPGAGKPGDQMALRLDPNIGPVMAPPIRDKQNEQGSRPPARWRRCRSALPHSSWRLNSHKCST
jgi:hypothetical protein